MLTVFGFVCLVKMVVDTLCMKSTRFSMDIHVKSVYSEDPERIIRILEGILANTLLLDKTDRIILHESIDIDKAQLERLKKEFPNIFLED